MRIERDSPEGQWLRSRWDNMLGMAPTAVNYTKWIVTGIAGIVAVILATLDSVANQASPLLFKSGMTVLIVSLMIGAVSCLLSLSLSAGVKARKRAEKSVSLSAPPVTAELLEELQSPFWGPLRWIIRRSLRKAMKDPLYVEKSQIFLVCLMNILIFSTVGLAAIGLILLVVGVNLGMQR